MEKIGPFVKYEQEPNDICYGSIYTLEMDLHIPYESQRTVRVYLPENYDKKKEYPVIYMSDGQNIVDKYTSAYGAWEIDKRQHELCEEGYPEYIVVGIDCPKNPVVRMLEYSFPGVELKPPKRPWFRRKKKFDIFSEQYFSFIVNELIPLVDKYFATSKKRELTATCGSSMGGVFALALFMSYPEVFGTALCFSPAYFMYKEENVDNFMNENMDRVPQDSKFYFYSGNVDFEHLFKEPAIKMHQYLLANGINHKNLYLSIDESGSHCEACWSKHFNEAIRFWFEK